MNDLAGRTKLTFSSAPPFHLPLFLPLITKPQGVLREDGIGPSWNARGEKYMAKQNGGRGVLWLNGEQECREIYVLFRGPGSVYRVIDP